LELGNKMNKVKKLTCAVENECKREQKHRQCREVEVLCGG